MELFEKILEAAPRYESLEEAVRAELAERKAAGEKFVPGFGKHLHPVDPRSARIFEILDQAKSDGTIAGNHLAVTLQIEAELKAQKGFLLPTNIDGAIAAVLGELGFAPPLGRGVFILGRAVGLLAHAWKRSRVDAAIRDQCRQAGFHPILVSGKYGRRFSEIIGS